jgi:ABC-type lipoprotein export system ATPase subunit
MLSMGEMQQVAAERALANDAESIIADEPTASWIQEPLGK